MNKKEPGVDTFSTISVCLCYGLVMVSCVLGKKLADTSWIEQRTPLAGGEEQRGRQRAEPDEGGACVEDAMAWLLACVVGRIHPLSFF
jgi:hypothetical protein